jgi:hypothetical protein
VRKVTAGPVGLGTSYESEWIKGSPMVIDYVRFERPTAWATVGRSSRLNANSEGRVTATEGGARLVIRMELQPQGAMRLLLPILNRTAFAPLLHRWRTRWGATSDEIARRLPGDEIVSVPTWSYNHAITVNAPRSKVWPWLLQLGQGRGGFYSYEVLENLVGCDIHNVTKIRPELQQLQVGDTIRVHASGFGPPVAVFDPERALVLGGPREAGGSRATWSFYLFDGPGDTTRLLERGRHVVGRGVLEKLGFGLHLIDQIRDESQDA